jgi:hypothetical protein
MIPVKELWSCKQKKSRWERYVEEIGEVNEGEYFLDDGFCRLGSTFQQLREGTGSERGGIRDLGTCLPKGSGTCALPLELL